MSEPDDKPETKVVSLDARRRADAARQKAELAEAVAAAKKRSNGTGRPLKQDFGQPMGTRSSNQEVGAVLGPILAWVVWGSLVVCGALAAYDAFGG